MCVCVCVCEEEVAVEIEKKNVKILDKRSLLCEGNELLHCLDQLLQCAESLIV